MAYLIIPLILLAPVLGLAVLSATAKRPALLGVINGRLAECPSAPNCVSSQAADPGHQIAPLKFEGGAVEALQRLKQVLGTIPRLKIVTEQDNYLHAEATSLLFRFVDDVEFLVDPQAGVIHCRSASRVGHSDLGVNRARIEQIRKAF